MSGYPNQPPGYGYGYGYGAPPPGQPHSANPYGAAPPQHGQGNPYAAAPAPHGQSNPYGAASAPYAAPYSSSSGHNKPPKDDSHYSHGSSVGYPPSSAPPYSSPFASLVPSAFPPGTDPNVVACFQMADQDGSGLIDDKEMQRALSSYSQSFSLRTVHLLMYHFTNTNVKKIGTLSLSLTLYFPSLETRTIFLAMEFESGKLGFPLTYAGGEGFPAHGAKMRGWKKTRGALVRALYLNEHMAE